MVTADSRVVTADAADHACLLGLPRVVAVATSGWSLRPPSTSTPSRTLPVHPPVPVGGRPTCWASGNTGCRARRPNCGPTASSSRPGRPVAPTPQRAGHRCPGGHGAHAHRSPRPLVAAAGPRRLPVRRARALSEGHAHRGRLRALIGRGVPPALTEPGRDAVMVDSRPVELHRPGHAVGRPAGGGRCLFRCHRPSPDRGAAWSSTPTVAPSTPCPTPRICPPRRTGRIQYSVSWGPGRWPR